MPAEEVGYKLLECFGTSPTLINRYRNGQNIVASFQGTLLVRRIIAYNACHPGEHDAALAALKADERVRVNQAPILCVSDGESILGYDPATEETYELNTLDRLYTDYQFFSPIWGVAQFHVQSESPADVKAAYKLSKLLDEIRRANNLAETDDLKDLNMFMMRLLFCFFAEDTGLFPRRNLFSDSIARFTLADGTDLQEYLHKIFRIMDVAPKNRPADLERSIADFPFVNGGLFRKESQIPAMNFRIRQQILSCGELDWGDINPDIFGSMVQAVVDTEKRSDFGMHYTSVPNIMKVIRPLFLDELDVLVRKLELDADDIVKKFPELSMRISRAKPIIIRCNKLLERISKMKFFDPACGSGNFLIISYKELRRMENRILKVNQKVSGTKNLFIECSAISLDQFYGIEIDDFACDTAILSLWLAEHQMNMEFLNEFQVNLSALPLKTNNCIMPGNASELPWAEVCPHNPNDEVFVFGNPPYQGARKQTPTQKREVRAVFRNTQGNGVIDYISIWFLLGAKYIKGTKAKCAFVSTNSISQGEQVGFIWPHIYAQNVEITFAHTSFKWSNNATHNAGVTCVIIGLSDAINHEKKVLFHDNNGENVDNINPYLTAKSNVFVIKDNQTPNGLPPCQFGSMPRDGGFLNMTPEEREDIIKECPDCEKFIFPYRGADDFINGGLRYCIWVTEEQADDAYTLPPLKKRFDGVRKFREKSQAVSTADYAQYPYMFVQRAHEFKNKIIIPSVSSERREYIPMGYLGKNDVVSNAAFAIFDAPLWLFGILESQMHMVWVRAIGGRLKTDYRYSVGLCYNPFPFPDLTQPKKDAIAAAAQKVLDVRDYHFDLTLAKLYDPDTMPTDLHEAHLQLDRVVEATYREAPFNTEEERLAFLIRRYERMTKNS